MFIARRVEPCFIKEASEVKGEKSGSSDDKEEDKKDEKGDIKMSTTHTLDKIKPEVAEKRPSMESN